MNEPFKVVVFSYEKNNGDSEKGVISKIKDELQTHITLQTNQVRTFQMCVESKLQTIHCSQLEQVNNLKG